jgi:hypothetical protein
MTTSIDAAIFQYKQRKVSIAYAMTTSIDATVFLYKQQKVVVVCATTTSIDATVFLYKQRKFVVAYVTTTSIDATILLYKKKKVSPHVRRQLLLMRRFSYKSCCRNLDEMLVSHCLPVLSILRHLFKFITNATSHKMTFQRLQIRRNINDITLQ